MKLVFLSPNSLALSFIFLTKDSSLPEMRSAIATVASLPEAIDIPFTISVTLIFSPTFKKIWLPPILAAFSEAVIISSHFKFPFSISSIIRSILIIFVIEAGASFSSLFFWNNISPVEASIIIALLALGAKSSSSALTTGTKRNKNKSINIFFITYHLVKTMLYNLKY